MVRYCFGTFEVCAGTGELWKHGRRVRVQPQPFLVLCALLERPGQLVTREELAGRLWPGNTFIDADLGLNVAVKKLRDRLGDSAERPRFVETLPRRGYRFVAPVSMVCGPRAEAEQAPLRRQQGRGEEPRTGSPATPPASPSAFGEARAQPRPPAFLHLRIWMAVALSGLILGAAAVLSLLSR